MPRVDFRLFKQRHTDARNHAAHVLAMRRQRIDDRSGRKRADHARHADLSRQSVHLNPDEVRAESIGRGVIALMSATQGWVLMRP